MSVALVMVDTMIARRFQTHPLRGMGSAVHIVWLCLRWSRARRRLSRGQIF